MLKFTYRPSLRARISHELRIPLTKIIGAVGLLSDTTLTREQQAHLSCIQSCAERLLFMQTQIDQFFRARETKKA